MTEERPLGAHVKPRLSDERLGRQWTAISARLGTPSQTNRRLAYALAAAAAVASGSLFVFDRLAKDAPVDVAWTGTVLESEDGISRVDLRDGSTIELEPATRLVFTKDASDETRVDLQQGTATFQIAKRERRAFHVSASGIDVQVVGTRFTVGYESSGTERRVHVDVEEGRVRVHTRDTTVSLSRGERWSAPAAPGQEAPAGASEARVEPAVPETKPEAKVEARPEHAPPSAEAVSKEAPESARSLFEAGNAARRSGDVAEAIRAYQAILDRFPGDQRAGLAAFELARLQMDRYGDAAGAVRSLERALASGAGSSFREDAMARLVSAYDAMGARNQCLRAKKAYLYRYPTGVHRAAVSARCGGAR